MVINPSPYGPPIRIDYTIIIDLSGEGEGGTRDGGLEWGIVDVTSATNSPFRDRDQRGFYR